MSPTKTGESMPDSVPPRVKRNAMIFLVLAGGAMWIPVAQALFGRPPGFLRHLGFLSGPRGTFVAWSVGFAVAGLYSAYAVRRIPLVRQHWRAVSVVKFVGVLVAISAAIVEEAFFRRLLMDALLRAGWPDALQVIASGVIFGAAHASWALVTGHVAVGVGAMIATGTLGTGLALAYILGDRSLAPVMVTATIQPGIMFAAFSGRMRQQEPPQHAA